MRIADSLRVGQTSPKIHHSWGGTGNHLPAIPRSGATYTSPNSNYIAETVLYTSSKDREKRTFLDVLLDTSRSALSCVRW